MSGRALLPPPSRLLASCRLGRAARPFATPVARRGPRLAPRKQHVRSNPTHEEYMAEWYRYSETAWGFWGVGDWQGHLLCTGLGTSRWHDPPLRRPCQAAGGSSKGRPCAGEDPGKRRGRQRRDQEPAAWHRRALHLAGLRAERHPGAPAGRRDATHRHQVSDWDSSWAFGDAVCTGLPISPRSLPPPPGGRSWRRLQAQQPQILPPLPNHHLFAPRRTIGFVGWISLICGSGCSCTTRPPPRGWTWCRRW